MRYATAQFPTFLRLFENDYNVSLQFQTVVEGLEEFKPAKVLRIPNLCQQHENPQLWR